MHEDCRACVPHHNCPFPVQNKHGLQTSRVQSHVEKKLCQNAMSRACWKRKCAE